MAALAPRRGELLWDIGAGAGSISIEWMLTDPSNRAVAIERDAKRVSRIARNAAALGVPDLVIVEGSAPMALRTLPRPDAIFIGGGLIGTIDAAWEALPSNGRMVANGVTIETQAELISRFKALGGRLKTIQVAQADPVGGFTVHASGQAGDSMGGDQAMIAIGVGCRRGARRRTRSRTWSARRWRRSPLASGGCSRSWTRKANQG